MVASELSTVLEKNTTKTKVRVAATDMRYFARSKFFGILVHKKNFGLI